MARKQRKRLIHRTVAPIRTLCYLLGPLAIGLMFSRYGHVLSVRFHIFHSMLMTGFWASLWGSLWAIEHISPWFTSMIAKETRFAMNLGFATLWAWLLLAAYYGGRCTIVPFIHRFAVRLARKQLAERRG